GHVRLERVEVEDQRRRVDFVEALPDLGRRASDAAGAAFCARWWNMYQTRAPVTMAISGSASRLTRDQPAVVTVSPEVHDETSIMMKMHWSLAPCAFAFSSGR